MTRRSHRLRTALAVLAIVTAVASQGCMQERTSGDDAASKEAKHEDPNGIRWRKISLDEAFEQARMERKLVFVDFWTSWCGWCKVLDEQTFSDPEVISAMNDRYVCLSIDAEGKDGAPIARRYGVRGYPHMLILQPDGKVKHQIGGFVPPAQFLPQIENDPVPR